MIDIVWMLLLITRHSRIIYARIRKSNHKITLREIICFAALIHICICSFAHFISQWALLEVFIESPTYLQVDQDNQIVNQSERLIYRVQQEWWPYVQESFFNLSIKISHRPFLCLLPFVEVKCWVIVIIFPKGVNKVLSMHFYLAVHLQGETSRSFTCFSKLDRITI